MATTSPPNWFRRALDMPFTDERVEVDGAAIHFLAWGEPGRRGLVFVHGGGAHAHWWTHVAATFAEEFRVLAVDLSGHGDSGHRDEYTLEQWTDEVMAVAAAGGIAGPPVVIGHSMGGFVTIATAARHAEQRERAPSCATRRSPSPTPRSPRTGCKEAFGAPRTYATVEDGMAHFRTVPPQDALPRLRDGPRGPPVAARRSTAAGSGSSTATCSRSSAAACAASRCPTWPRSPAGWPCCGPSTASSPPTSAAFMYERLGRVTPVIEIPEAGHHAMLDQPLILLTALRTPAGRLGPLRPPPPPVAARATLSREGAGRAGSARRRGRAPA